MMGLTSHRCFTFCILLGVLSATVAESAPGSEVVDEASNSDLVQELVEVSVPARHRGQQRAMAEKVSSMLQAMQAAAVKTASTEKGKQALAKKVASTLRTMIQEKQAAAAEKKKSVAEHHTVKAAQPAKKKAEPVLTHVKNGANLLSNMAHEDEAQAAEAVMKKKKALTQTKAATKAAKKAAHEHVLANALRQIADHKASNRASHAAEVKASKAVMRDELDLSSSETSISEVPKTTPKQEKMLHQYDNEDEEEYEDEDEEEAPFESVIRKQDRHLSRVNAKYKADKLKRQKRRAAEKKTKAIMSDLLGSDEKKKRKSHTAHSQPKSSKKAVVHKVKKVKVKVQSKAKSKPVHKPKPVTEVDVVGSMLEELVGKPKKKKISAQKRFENELRQKKKSKPLTAHEQRLASLHPDLKHFFEPHTSKKKPAVAKKAKTVAKVKTTPKPKVVKVVKKVVPAKPVLPVFHLEEPTKPKHVKVKKAQHKGKSLLDTALQEAAEADQKISLSDMEAVKDMLKPEPEAFKPKKVAPVQKKDASSAQDEIFNSFETSLKKRVAKQAQQRKQEEEAFAATVAGDMAKAKARRAARKARREKRKKAAKKAAKKAHISRLHNLMHAAHQQMANDLGVTTKGRRVQHEEMKKQISSHFDPDAKQDALAASIAKKLFANLKKHGKKAVTQEEIAAAVRSVPSAPVKALKKKPSAPVKALKKKAHTVSKHATKVAPAAHQTTVLVAQSKVDKVFDKLDKIMEAKELLASI